LIANVAPWLNEHLLRVAFALLDEEVIGDVGAVPRGRSGAAIVDALPSVTI
jgi:hypothetical protein